jgi:hypothetical protein
VGQDDGVQVVDVLPGRGHDVELVADVDEHAAPAGDEKDVAGERVRPPREVSNHTPASTGPGMSVSLPDERVPGRAATARIYQQ